jgi:alpha-1,3-fucosyltransferase
MSSATMSKTDKKCFGVDLQFDIFRAPARLNHNLKKDANIFNLTMTCRLDSDFPWTYGEIIEIESKKVVAPAINVDWKQPNENFKDDKIMEIIKKKTKFAAWFASNNQSTRSKRKELIKKLQDYGIEIDIYGKAGNLSLSKDPVIESKLLEENYKFYLSFENALCVDYVTEKLFKVMNSLVIPVVYSGADLKRFAPPNSYIDANSFKSAKKLAKYLKFLAENPEEYIKFFWWKKHYKARTIEQFTVDPSHMCKICEKFNDSKFKTKHQVYSDIHKWFHENITMKPSIKFL